MESDRMAWVQQAPMSYHGWKRCKGLAGDTKGKLPEISQGCYQKICQCCSQMLRPVEVCVCVWVCVSECLSCMYICNYVRKYINRLKGRFGPILNKGVEFDMIVDYMEKNE